MPTQIRAYGLGMSKQRIINHKLHIFFGVISLGNWFVIYAILFIYYKLTGSTIETRRGRRMGAMEKRRSKRAIRKEKRRSKRAKLKEDRRITRDLIKATKARRGYTPGNWNSSQNYTLACGHQISAKKQVGMFSKGLLNHQVWCEVCNSQRTVTGTLYPWDNR
jgi:hypothetical protein